MNRTGSVENVVKEVRNKNPTNLFASNEKMFRSCDDITGLFSTNQRANGYQHNSKASSR